VTLLGDAKGNFYVIEVLRGRFLYHELKARAISQGRKHKPCKILVEQAGLGGALIRDLRAAGLPAVGVIPEGDKFIRVSVQLEKFANGQVFSPRAAPWLIDFENELVAFPSGRYDDQVDALIQALEYRRPSFLWDADGPTGWGMPLTYRRVIVAEFCFPQNREFPIAIFRPWFELSGTVIGSRSEDHAGVA
jgi:predicted phage terminase large subunit-like protein